MMENIESSDLSYQELEGLFFQASHAIETAFRKKLRQSHIPPQVALILVAIARLDEPSPTEVSKDVHRKPQTITAILNRMETMGLIQRTINENKKNSYIIHLTKKGWAVHSRIGSITIFKKVVKALPEEKRWQLKECLEQMMIGIHKARI